jgi:hypothetical protein
VLEYLLCRQENMSSNFSPTKKKKKRRLHLSPVRMAIKNTKTINVGKDVVKKEPSYTFGGNVN